MKLLQPLYFIWFFLVLFYTTPAIGQITYTVNTTDDTNDGVCNTIHCSLREAIIQSYADNVPSNIHFNISGSGPHIIYPTKDLIGLVEDYTIIDGTTQPNYMLGDIIIDGQLIQNEDGLSISGDHCQVKGLYIRNFSKGIWLSSNDCSIGSVGKENIIGNNHTGIFVGSTLRSFIQNNFFGTNELSEDLGNYSIGLYLQGQPVELTTRDNIFGFNHLVGIHEEIVNGSQNTYQNNSFFCNGDAFQTGNNVSVPIITTASILNNTVSGTATSNGFVDLFLSVNTSCEDAACQGSELIGTTSTNANGEWSITNLDLSIGTRLTTLFRSTTGLRSDFSACTLINDCTTTTLNATFNFSNSIVIGENYIFDAQPTGGTVPYLSHTWTQSYPNGLLSIENNGDGTASIQGLRVGWVTLTYEVIDSEGCIFSMNKSINIDILCSPYQIDDTTIEVVNTNDSGVGSLRYAINCAIANESIDQINFNIPGDAPHIINLASTLPNLSDPGIIVDGTTQPNYQIGDIIIDGGNNPIILNGISITTENCEIYGLHLRKFRSSGIDCSQVSNGTKIGAINKANILTENKIGVSISYYDDTSPISSTISYNYIGTNPALEDLGNFWEGINIQGSEATITNNIIAYNQRTGILPQVVDNITISENTFLCNNIGIRLNDANQNKISPIINSINTTINGLGLPNDKIEVFLADETCPYVTCQGNIFLGSTVADPAGNWSLSTPGSLKSGDRITATATDVAGNTSPFSSCYIVLPDDCATAEVLPVNEAPCSTTGVVLDLKQMTTSSLVPTSDCATTFAGSDAWCIVTIPSTGNLLVRSNINNTIKPVIEAYSGTCNGLVLQQCQEIDSIPYSMVFENYTPGASIFLRIWDKDNALVNSENSALLHLTAHELPLLKDFWEVCDYENNLITGNPTILSERDANTFILEYDDTATPEEIATLKAELEAMGDILIDECLCNSVPLQLWATENPIDLEDRRRRIRKKTKTNDPNYNYVFEHKEFQINAYPIGKQYAPSVSRDKEGNFVIAWTDEQRRHNYARVYISSGNPITPERQLGTKDKVQQETDISMNDSGEFIAVWHESDHLNTTNTYTIYGRIYNSDGTPKNPAFNISTIAANTSSSSDIRLTAQYGTYPQVASDQNGNFVVVWHNQRHIYAQRYNSTGSILGTIIEVNSAEINTIQPSPKIALNDAGEFIIVWNGKDSEKNGIYAQRFDDVGQKMGSVFLVNQEEKENQSNPDVVIGNDGQYIITWESFEQEGIDLEYGIYAQIFDQSGNRINNEFLVNTYQQKAQRFPSISLFDDGAFLIAWSSYEQDGFKEGIFGQFFDKTGLKIEEEFQINAFDEPDQDKPQTATNGNSIALIAWEDGGNDGSFKGIFGQRYEILNQANKKEFYPISTATPSTLLGDQLVFPNTIYQPNQTTKNVKVAIIDTGIDSNHSYLTNAIWNNLESNDEDNCVIGDQIGYDFVNEFGNPIDLDGHGTKVNGIIVRDFDNSVQLELMNLKFHEQGEGNVFDAICAIYYAVDNGADVLNLSWGFEASEFPTILYKALKYASDNDVLIVTTAGNTSKNNDDINKFPANLNIENLLVVTSYEYKQSTGAIKLANYASYGKQNVDIAAYGFVESPTIGGTLEVVAGTSLAAPAVVNTAATIKGLYPILSASEIKECILSSVTTVNSLEDKVATGGILNYNAALICAKNKSEAIINMACNNSSMEVSIEVNNANCFQLGSINLSITNVPETPSIIWHTGATTPTITQLSSGSYYVTITDNQRCVVERVVMIEEECANNTCQSSNVIISTNPITDSIYQSSNTIVSSGQLNDNSEVVFKATESILLKSGFHAKSGSKFLAMIEPCLFSLDKEENSYTDTLPNIKSRDWQNKIKVYPNPTKDVLFIDIPRTKETNHNIELYDLMGRRILSKYSNDQKNTLDIQELPSGVYILNIDEYPIKKVILVK